MTSTFKFSLLGFSLLLLVLLACNPDEPNPGPEEFVFFNGKVYTVDETNPWAEAIHIRDGVIQFIGDDADAQANASEDAELIDLKGIFVMPGIHDVHMHPLEASSENFHFTVNGSETDPEVYANDVDKAIRNNPGTGWILGWGHEFETVLEATRSPKMILDDVAPNRPVAIMEQTSHSVWCNSKALELMGIDRNSTNPIGGIIMRESDGEPSGILVDNAGNLLIDMALPADASREENDYLGLIEYALPELAKHGITSFCDARTYWKRNHDKTWKRIADEGKLTARVNLGLWAYPTEDDATQIQTLKSLYSFDTNSLLKVNQIKLYADGIIHNTTAALHRDYLEDYFEQPTNNGLNYFTEQRMADYIAALEGTGFDFHIHALGNRGIHEALNAIEQKGTVNGRHRLTHIEYMDQVDVSRFAGLNVTADAQVAGDFSQPMNWFGFADLIGPSLSQDVIPLKKLQAANARVTLSSDWDVSTLNPFVGLQHAVTRSPQELTLAEAIKAYTLNPAYVMRQETITGSLEVGKEADLIMLNKNPFDIDAEKISTIKVLETYLQGKRVY